MGTVLGSASNPQVQGVQAAEANVTAAADTKLHSHLDLMAPNAV